MELGYFQRMPSEVEVLAVLAEAGSGLGHRTMKQRWPSSHQPAAFTEQLTGTEEVQAILQRDQPERFADAMQRLAQLFRGTAVSARQWSCTG